MLEILQDTLIDGIKLLPFLFITYFIMEYIEHHTEKKTRKTIENAGKLGPLWGGVLGIFPQCGFSAASASLYAGRVISIGTVIAVFLSTSDEMLPIFISKTVPATLILKILLIKMSIGIFFGFLIDFVYRALKKKQDINRKKQPKESLENKEEILPKESAQTSINHICEHDHCDCEHDGIIKSALKHTFRIFIFVFIVSLFANIIIGWIGEETIASYVSEIPIMGVAISCLIGLIPNCASSVIITELYLSKLITFGTMIAGLLVGSGVGILILFRSNKNIKENILITILLYGIGFLCGTMINLFS